MNLPDLSLLVIVAIFWATYLVLRTFVFKPLGGILQEREDTARTADEALKKALERQKEVSSEVDRRLTEARRDALGIRDAARAAANAKRNVVLDEARETAHRSALEAQARLEAEIAAARGRLREEAQVIAGEIATFVMGRKVA